MSALEKACQAAALANEDDSCFDAVIAYEPVVRAVLMAVREVDPVIKSDITAGGWLEDELKYDDVWQGTIDRILNEEPK